MNLFGDKDLKEENRSLRRQVKSLENIERDLRFNQTDGDTRRELEFLREAVKPYVRIGTKWLPTYAQSKYGFPIEHYYYAERTLEKAECDIKNLNLYIAVLEGELGPEKTASAKQKLEALKAIGNVKYEVKGEFG